MGNVLDVKDLCVTVADKAQDRMIVDHVSFRVPEGRCIGILGESGSGKSTVAKALLRLTPADFRISGVAQFDGVSLLEAPEESLRKIRGSEITMVLQSPMTCFDPLYPIGVQIAETLRAHAIDGAQQLRERSLALLAQMQIKNGAEVLSKYPHELSGGMLQRIMIGLALALKPRLLIADEATTAIDAITQFEIMKEFQKIKEAGTSMLFISHDLGVISCVADEVLVMRDGKIVERGSFHEVLEHAQDPYTRLLVEKRRMVLKRYRSAMAKEKIV